jgi:hypothetical protein
MKRSHTQHREPQCRRARDTCNRCTFFVHYHVICGLLFQGCFILYQESCRNARRDCEGYPLDVVMFDLPVTTRTQLMDGSSAIRRIARAARTGCRHETDKKQKTGYETFEQ